MEVAPKCGDSALSAVGTPRPGDGGLGVRLALCLPKNDAGFYNPPPDPFPGGIGEAAATSIPLRSSQLFLDLPNVAVSKAMALICGYRIDETIYHLLTCSAEEATKRTILQPYSIRRMLL